MDKNRDIQELLRETPAPRVAAGAHREQLKAELLHAMRNMPCSSSNWKMAMVVGCLAALLATSGWAAHAVYYRVFVLEQEVESKVVHPDGSVTASPSTVVASSSDTDVTRDDAMKQWERIKRAIEKGSYVLSDVIETGSDRPVFMYRVEFEDGSTTLFGVTDPLPATKAD